MVSARQKGPTGSATSPAFTNGFINRGALLVVNETRLDPDCLLHTAQAILTADKAYGGARHTIATRLVTQVPNVSPTPIVTCFTHVPSRHDTRQVYDHMIVSFDIIVE